MSGQSNNTGDAASSSPSMSSSLQSISPPPLSVSSHHSPSSMRQRSAALPFVVKVYLSGYNILSTGLWLHLLWRTVEHVYGLGLPLLESFDGHSLWSEIEGHLKAVQTVALLELLHGGLGWVRTGFLTLFVQLVSRLQLVWIIWCFVETGRAGPWMAGAVVAWSLAELVRYPFYAMAVWGSGKLCFTIKQGQLEIE
eukprot:GHVQ01032847.1.p1 GENE.GHVQ01032847.1~~GHVQ01032847.1.p1  ORF type:complete len:196 (-),score=26.18 GHVQ01032847.1:1494-2081(-)